MSADIVPLPRPRPNGADPAPSLDPMLAITATGMNAVNAVILARMQSEIPLIPALAGHLISGGGKRLRPFLVVESSAVFGVPRAAAKSTTSSLSSMVQKALPIIPAVSRWIGRTVG